MSPKILWIANALLVTQNSKRQIFKGHIRIVDGVIDSIVKTLPRKKSRTETILDAKGAAVLPGFVQTHIHLAQTLFKNQADDLELLDWLSQRIWPFEAAHTAETLGVSAEWGIYEMLSSGTTCVLDMATVRHTEAIFKAATRLGIRANIGKCLMDHPTDTPAILREDTNDALDEAVALIKKWHRTSNDRIRASFAPRFVLTCTDELLEKVGKLSEQNEIIIHTHASENTKEIVRVQERSGCENVEYLHRLGLVSDRLVLAHCVWLKPHELEVLKRSRANVVHCPSSNLKLASGVARIPEMLQAGISVSLGADGAACNNNLNMFQEMRLAALIHKPGHGPKTIRAQEALDLATLNGARALHWDDQIGSIEPGKKADLFALDLSQPENLSSGRHAEEIVSSIVYSSGPQHVLWTLVDGKKVYDQSQSRRGIWPALRAKVLRAQNLIAKRAKAVRKS